MISIKLGQAPAGFWCFISVCRQCRWLPECICCWQHKGDWQKWCVAWKQQKCLLLNFAALIGDKVIQIPLCFQNKNVLKHFSSCSERGQLQLQFRADGFLSRRLWYNHAPSQAQWTPQCPPLASSWTAPQTVLTCHRLVLYWDHPHILTAAHGYIQPNGEVSSAAANRDPTGKRQFNLQWAKAAADIYYSCTFI